MATKKPKKDTSFADLVARLNAMSNMTKEEERASLMEAANNEPRILDEKEVSLADIAKLAGIKEYQEETKVSPKAEKLVESISSSGSSISSSPTSSSVGCSSAGCSSTAGSSASGSFSCTTSSSGASAFSASAIISVVSGVFIKNESSFTSTSLFEKELYNSASLSASASLTYSVISLTKVSLNASGSNVASSFSSAFSSASCARKRT